MRFHMVLQVTFSYKALATFIACVRLFIVRGTTIIVVSCCFTVVVRLFAFLAEVLRRIAYKIQKISKNALQHETGLGALVQKGQISIPGVNTM